ncbi:sugar phosphate isomerase/epimerase family protein [Daeguia caeni]|uniref:Sugar phosphate isomerase/epimerase family protein n=1 Tax=Daeguia caeni TaxID=439612 RepID=A0ABV9H807_9HYPH
MRLAISNIAWDTEEDPEVAKLLQTFRIDAIDIAPGKYFPVPAAAKDADISRVKHWWLDRGIEITGMQGLLFGTTGLNLFGDSQSRQDMLEHLRAVCRIGGKLGATRLVFGSPKNRDRTGLNDEQALEQAVSFFRQLGDIAQEHGVIMCLEPNPVRYGANFMITSEETAKIVMAADHPAIRMQFDTGAVVINGEQAETILANHADLIGHIHLSEPGLAPLGDGDTDHAFMSKVLASHLPGKVASIEMVATTQEPHLVSIERALSRAVALYRAIQV